ncbi:MAG: GatB/YqeY domain-containing protein, partial [Sediminibacterium sp.]|nr:GatB/YqeY domain-containing protein [Sediminibacterium sp.]
MSLELKIMEKLKEAMKLKDEASLRGIRAIKAEIIKAKTDPGANGQINEEQEIKLLQKLLKQRKDSLEIYEKQNRPDLAQKEIEEIKIIEAYLPAQLSIDEITQIVKNIIQENNAVGIQFLGKIMGIASKQLAGKADGATISTIAKQLLTQ